MNTVIAGTNPAQVDVLGASLFDKTTNDIGYLKLLSERGYAEMDPQNLKYNRITA